LVLYVPDVTPLILHIPKIIGVARNLHLFKYGISLSKTNMCAASRMGFHPIQNTASSFNSAYSADGLYVFYRVLKKDVPIKLLGTRFPNAIYFEPGTYM
jgi:hypothetical protein